MDKVDDLFVVKRGQWFHGGVTTCPVHIVRHNTLYGTHDPEDPPELALDMAAECFYVRYLSPDARGVWLDGGSALSLREAIFLARRKLGPVMQWDD
jgi:hypothetical protein